MCVSIICNFCCACEWQDKCDSLFVF